MTFLLALAALLALVALLVKALRTMASSALAISLVAAASLAIGIGWESFKRNHRLSHVPDGLRVRRVLYAKEESWGFGPGGNEAGIVAYPLSENTAKAIEIAGLRYFENLPPNRDQQSRDWRGRFADWKSTPVEPGPHWKPDPGSGRYDIYQYICAYGFCIDIDERIEMEAAAAVNNPGNYYAYGRIGMIVVCPGMRRVFFMYNG